MTLAAAQLLVTIVALYAALGAAFAVLFLWRGVGRLDPAAAHATWGFCVLVFPGIAMLWPLFAFRWLRGTSAPPDEWTAHRAAVKRRDRIEVLR